MRSQVATLLVLTTVAILLNSNPAEGEICWFGPLKIPADQNVAKNLKAICDYGYIQEGQLNSCYTGSTLTPVNVSTPVSKGARDSCALAVSKDEDQWSVTAPDACRMCDSDPEFTALKKKHQEQKKGASSGSQANAPANNNGADNRKTTTSKPLTTEMTEAEKKLKQLFVNSQKSTEIPQETVLSSTNTVVGDIARGCYLKYMNHGLQRNSILFWFIVHQDLPGIEINYSKRCSSQSDFIGDSQSSDFLKRILVKCEVDSDDSEVVTLSSLFGTTELQYTEGLGSTCGHSSLSVWQNVVSDNRFMAQGLNYLLCRNGTAATVSTRVLSGHDSCAIIFMSRFLESCDSKADIGQDNHCKIESSDSVGFNHRLTVLNRPAGVVTINSDLEEISKQCTERCEVTVKSAIYLVLVCTSGKQVFKQYVDEVSVKCPFISYALSGRAASAVCRATDYPVLVMVLIVWVFAGYLICMIVLVLLKLLIIVSCGSARMIKTAIMRSKVICEDCDCEVEFKSLESLHEVCESGICPFCRLFMGEKLKEHVKMCPERKARMTTAAIEEGKRRKKSDAYKRLIRILNSAKLPVILWFIVAFALCLPIAVGEVGQQPERVQNILDSLYSKSSLTGTLIRRATYLEELNQRLEDCGTGCVRSGLECECSKEREEMMYGRRLLAVEEDSYKQSPIGNPQGFINPNRTFAPTISEDTIELVFQSSTRTGNTIVVSGNSVTDFVPEENAGLGFKVSSPESDESKTLSVSIKTIAQVYKSRFIKWISDRTVITDSEIDCTGACTSRCECNSTDCVSKRWPEDRGWSCNPSWCWSVNTGCTCCMMHAVPNAETALYSLWEVDYLETRLVVCVNSDLGHYSCKELTGGGNFNIEKFEIGITKPFGKFNTLPSTIAIKHDVSHSHPSISQATTIFLNPDFCETRHCTHGELGDYSFTSIDSLSKKIGSNVHKNIYMSWKGTSIDRTCEFAEGPRCMESGVVVSQKDLFQNFEQTGDKIGNKFKVISSVVQHDEDGNPSLKLAVSPLIQKGLCQMLIKVKGLELRSSRVALEIAKFEITRCGGCRNCVQGFWCSVKLSLTKPESYFIHLESGVPSTTVDRRSVLITNQIEIINVSLFSAVKESNVKLCVVEAKICSEIDNITLTDPIGILIDSGTQIIAPFQNVTAVDLTWISGLGRRIGGMFEGMWESIKWLFGGWLQSFVTILVLLLLVMFVIRPCRGRRVGLPGFSILRRREHFGRSKRKQKSDKQV